MPCALRLHIYARPAGELGLGLAHGARQRHNGYRCAWNNQKGAGLHRARPLCSGSCRSLLIPGHSHGLGVNSACCFMWSQISSLLGGASCEGGLASAVPHAASSIKVARTMLVSSLFMEASSLYCPRRLWFRQTPAASNDDTYPQLGTGWTKCTVVVDAYRIAGLTYG